MAAVTCSALLGWKHVDLCPTFAFPRLETPWPCVAADLCVPGCRYLPRMRIIDKHATFYVEVGTVVAMPGYNDCGPCSALVCLLRFRSAPSGPYTVPGYNSSGPCSLLSRSSLSFLVHESCGSNIMACNDDFFYLGRRSQELDLAVPAAQEG